MDPISEAAAADYIFVAVPTPYKNGQDLTEMDDAIENVVNHLVHPAEQTVIIKSTVLPGTTENYQKKYPGANFVFNPEFLTEKTAAEDFAKPDKQIIGYTSKTEGIAETALKILPDAPYKKVMPAVDAEMTKYTVNAYYAFKVIFGNVIYDYSQKLGIDYKDVWEGLVADQRIVDSHFDVLHGGYRGFGGKCLPKDIESLSAFAKKLGVSVEFIDKITELNKHLRTIQNG